MERGDTLVSDSLLSFLPTQKGMVSCAAAVSGEAAFRIDVDEAMRHHTASGRISWLADPGMGVVEWPHIPVLMREGEVGSLAWDQESSVLMARPAFLCLLCMRKAPAQLLCCRAWQVFWLRSV